MEKSVRCKCTWALFPRRTRFLDISPWLYSIIAFLGALASLIFVNLERNAAHSPPVVSWIIAGFVIETDSGLEIWDLDLHGPYNTALRNSTVGTVFGAYPDNQTTQSRGSLHFGKRILLRVTINDAPAEIATVMELLPQIAEHSKITFGDFLHRSRGDGSLYFSYPRDPWRFAWSNLAWDALVALPILAFLWLVGWQVMVVAEGCRRKRLANGTCPRCRYDIRALPEPRCPECGETW